MPRRKSARIKQNEQHKQQREVNKGPCNNNDGVVTVESDDEAVPATVTLDDSSTNPDTALTLDDSPIKLDASLQALMSQIDAQCAEHEAECIGSAVDNNDGDDDIITITNTPPPALQNNTSTIFVRHHAKKFGFTPFQIDVTSVRSLLDVYKNVASRLDLPVYEFRLQYKQVGRGDDSEMVTLKPGKSLSAQHMPRDVVLLECVDGFPLDVDKEDVVDIAMQRLVKRREGMSNASLDKVTLPCAKYELMKHVCRRYCQQQGVPLAKCKFTWDGDVLDMTQTAFDLDLDSGDVIDCQLLP